MKIVKSATGDVPIEIREDGETGTIQITHKGEVVSEQKSEEPSSHQFELTNPLNGLNDLYIVKATPGPEGYLIEINRNGLDLSDPTAESVDGEWAAIGTVDESPGPGREVAVCYWIGAVILLLALLVAKRWEFNPQVWKWLAISCGVGISFIVLGRVLAMRK